LKKCDIFFYIHFTEKLTFDTIATHKKDVSPEEMEKAAKEFFT